MSNSNALIGHTGFVGGNLLAQQPFGATFNSSNIASIRGRSFDHVICAGVSAVKWWANKNAEEDRRRIEALIADLDTISAARFTLISTIDVYATPIDVRESDAPVLEGLHAYGLNRAMLERHIAARFPVHHIVRLPGLFGDGLKKNAIFDMMHGNMLDVINPASAFQWYPLDRLSADIETTARAGLALLNVATEPVTTGAIRDRFFPGVEIGANASGTARYDMRSEHAALFNGHDGNLMDAEAVLTSLGGFIARARPRG